MLFLIDVALPILVILIIIFFVANTIRYFVRKPTEISQSTETSLSLEESTTERNLSNKSNIFDSDIKNYEPTLLQTGQLITLENICISFIEFINQIKSKQKIDVNLLTQYNEENIKLLVLHDICNIFHFLEISLLNKGIEREIWYATVSYFINNTIEYSELQEKDIAKTIQYLIAPDFSVYSDIYTHPFTALVSLKENDSELYNSYKLLLRDFVSFITTIDFDLNLRETKLMQIMSRLYYK